MGEPLTCYISISGRTRVEHMKLPEKSLPCSFQKSYHELSFLFQEEQTFYHHVVLVNTKQLVTKAYDANNTLFTRT